MGRNKFNWNKYNQKFAATRARKQKEFDQKYYDEQDLNALIEYEKQHDDMWNTAIKQTYAAKPASVVWENDQEFALGYANEEHWQARSGKNLHYIGPKTAIKPEVYKPFDDSDELVVIWQK